MQYPHLTEDQINQATRAYMMQIQSGFTGRVDYDRSHYAQVRNPNEATPQIICLPLFREVLAQNFINGLKYVIPDATQIAVQANKEENSYEPHDVKSTTKTEICDNPKQYASEEHTPPNNNTKYPQTPKYLNNLMSVYKPFER